jgi:hypothetical protein
MNATLSERLVASPSGLRVVPLEVERGYRDAAEEELSVSLTRLVQCKHCERKGCDRCCAVGWLVEGTSTNVVVPAGSTPGTRITVHGVGDENEGIAGSIVVEIVKPGPRADELRDLQKDFEEKLETAWQMDRTASAKRTRRKRLAAGACGLILLLLPIGRWVAKGTTGEPCTSSSDCRSAECISLIANPHAEPGSYERLDGKVCTSSCKTDLDCPEKMECREAHSRAERRTQIAIDVPEGLACIPHGY